MFSRASVIKKNARIKLAVIVQNHFSSEKLTQKRKMWQRIEKYPVIQLSVPLCTFKWALGYLSNKVPSSETQGQIVGARERLNGRKKNGAKKCPWVSEDDKVLDERIPGLNEAFNDIVKRCVEHNTKLTSVFQVKVVQKNP